MRRSAAGFRATMRVIYDDSVRVPADVAALAGIARFGRLIYQRRPLAQRFVDMAEAASVDVMHIKTEQELAALRDEVAGRPTFSRYLYIPSNLVPARPDAEMGGFLGKLRYALPNLRIDVGKGPEWTGIALMEPVVCRGFLEAQLDRTLGQFMAAEAELFSPVDNSIGFVDLRDYAAFIEYLTSNFEVRHFNAIDSSDPYTIRKRSRDKVKLRREYDYFSLLPEHLQRFFVRPFGFEDSGQWASYRMERLLLPDMAIQWIHGSLTVEEFDRFLDQVFHFIEERPRRSVGVDEVKACADGLYLRKLDDRMAALRTTPFYPKLEQLLSSRTRGGLEALVGRFKHLYGSLKRAWRGELVLGHGDLCFPNILYGKSARIMKLIDPRGAANVAELFTDPYYDIAKLSHSILGGYDYINNGLFSVGVNGDLHLELQLELGDHATEQARFRAVLGDRGFDERLSRLYEASLFLSMLPLHADVPRKVAAFALTAGAILDELEAS
jgi:hypothetical protein